MEVKEGEQQLIKIKYDIRGPPFDAENKREKIHQRKEVLPREEDENNQVGVSVHDRHAWHW